jgi:hypothetical protein
MLLLLLRLACVSIIVSLGWQTVLACQQAPVWNVPGFATSLWFQATLMDAYFGFFFFFLWVCHKEKSVMKRVLWGLLIAALGNMAMASYVLLVTRKATSETLKEVLFQS